MKDEKWNLQETKGLMPTPCVESATAKIACNHADEELAQYELEKMCRILVKLSPEAIIITNKEGFITHVSEKALELHNTDADHLLDMSFFDLVALEDQQKAVAAFCHTLSTGSFKGLEIAMVKEDESSFIGEVNISILCENEDVKAFIISTRDTTTRKLVEKTLRESEEKYRTLTHNLNVGVYRNTAGPKGKFIEANPAIVKMFSYKDKEDFLKIDVADLYQNPKDRKKFNEKMLQDGFVRFEELQLKKKDGTPFIGSVSAVAVTDEEGTPQYYDGIIEDITEKKQAEMQLQNIFEASRLINSTVEIERTFEFISDSIQQLVGFDNFIIFLVSEDQSKIYTAYASQQIRKVIEDVVLHYGEGLVGHCIQNEEILLVKNARKDERGKIVSGTEVCVSQILVPLIIKNQCVGALHISKSKENAYNEKNVNALKPLSEVISSAINNSRLHNEIKQFNRELERRIKERSRRIEIILNARQQLQRERNWERGLKSIVESINELGFENVGVFLVDSMRKRLIYHSGKGVAPEERSISLDHRGQPGVECVLEKQTTEFTDSSLKKSGSTIWVPIVVQDEAFAVLTAGSIHSITEEAVKDLEIMAGMCGTFIDRTRIQIEPTAEKTLATDIKHWLNPAEGYIILERKPERSFQIFTDLVVHGIPGFVVSREHPEKLKRKYELVRTPVLWLSRMEVKNALSPDDLPKLQYIVDDFTRKSENSVILLDGLEYLITQNSFDTVIKQLQELKDSVILHNSRLIIPLYQEALSPREFNMLVRELTIVE